MGEKCLLAVAARADIASQYPMSDVPRPSPPVFLKKTEDFERVKREGKRITTKFFNLVSCASSLGTTRVGIVVGRRFGNAVVRNRGKRMFRALVRNTYQLLVTGHDIIIFPKPSVLSLNHHTLSEAWMQTLSRQGLAVSPKPLPCAK